MSRIFRVCLVLLTGLSLVSCSKEKSVEKSQNTGSAVTGLLRMKIDGTQWVADKAAGATIESGVIGIYGLGKDRKQFVLVLSGTSAATYKLDQAALNAAALTDSAETNQFAYASNQGDTSQGGGTVIVTKIDDVKKTISGTFQVKVFREMDNKGKVITEGVFEDLSYAPVQPPPTQNPGGGGTGTLGDTLKVKINGTDLNVSLVAGISTAGLLTISATEASSMKSVGLVMPDKIAVGQYAIGGLGDTYMGSYNASQSQFLVSESGKLVITEHNTTTRRIKGTFEFKAKDVAGGTLTAQLTAGSFSLTYK